MSKKQTDEEKEIRSIGATLISGGSGLKNALANSINQFSNTDNWNIFTEIEDREQGRIISNRLMLADYFDIDLIRTREQSILILMKNKGRAMEDAFVRIHSDVKKTQLDDVDKNVGVKNQLREFLGVSPNE